MTKLLRCGHAGQEKPDLLGPNGDTRVLSAHVQGVSGDKLSISSHSRVAALNASSLPLVDGATRVGPSVGNAGNFACIGLNCADCAEESGMALPEETMKFFKATSSMTGTNDSVEIPRGSRKSDREVELGVVIGKEAKGLFL